VVNRGRLLRGEDIKGTLFPVTPLSCLQLLKSAGVSPEGKKVTIVGRGETVGLPLAVMLIRMSATVTVCHTKTQDLKNEVLRSDIVISACGVPGLVKAEYLRPGQIVIDAGISRLPDGRVAGDADPKAAEIVSYLSPVPGGVGALTGILLMRNLIKAAKLQKGS
jgi:methylenetetrahydrofolate dehydrogenase (NADP+)/methenyltetrahydrofolate cyclohydrolase